MILVAGGSGYLGTTIIKYLEISREIELVNLSSKINPSLSDSVVQHQVDLANYESILEISETLKKNIRVIINVAGRSKRKKNDESAFPDFDLLAKDSLHDFRILYNLARLMNDHPQLFEPEAKLIDIGSLWASRIPYSRTYLDLGNEPDVSVLISKSNKRVFVRYLARELSKHGFTANQLTPGWFPKPSQNPREDYIQGIVSRVPLGRIGRPSDLLPALEMLMSKDSNYINGQEIIVDGGFSIY